MDELNRRCGVYLKMLENCDTEELGGTTWLDEHRYNVCRINVENIVETIRINGRLPDNNYLRIALIHARKYLHSLEEIIEDVSIWASLRKGWKSAVGLKRRDYDHQPQDALPDVYIWMIAGSKRVAYTRLPAFLLTYEEDETTRGKSCGERVSLFFKDPLDDARAMDQSACCAEIFLWLGNMRHINACWSMIPPGYEVDHNANLDAFPAVLEFTKSSVSFGELDARFSSIFMIGILFFRNFNYALTYFKDDSILVWTLRVSQILWFELFFTDARWPLG